MVRQVSAVILAAGKSTRMGQDKLLLPLVDRPVIRWSIDTFLATDIDHLVVVTPPGGRAIQQILTPLPVQTVTNYDVAGDMASSLRAGIRRLPPFSSGILVSPADMPLVRSETIQRLIDAHRRYPGAIFIPCWQGRRGHPTLFPRQLLAAIHHLPTLRHLLHGHAPSLRHLELSDPGILMDMDTPNDYGLVVTLAGEQRPPRRSY
jgi:CTP:molybdopterin cytidylyltransferase MocA